MTVYQCSTCGNAHDSSEPACPQAFSATVVTPPPTARDVGAQIRELLLSLKDTGASGYALDQLRAEALQHAGFCWIAPGEMAPQCCCEWDPETNPSGPMLRAMLRMYGEPHVRANMGWLKASKGAGHVG